MLTYWSYLKIDELLAIRSTMEPFLDECAAAVLDLQRPHETT